VALGESLLHRSGSSAETPKSRFVEPRPDLGARLPGQKANPTWQPGVSRSARTSLSAPMKCPRFSLTCMTNGGTSSPPPSTLVCELCGLLKADVDIPNRTLLVARSYDRDTTKGGNTPKSTGIRNLRPPWRPGQSGNPAGRPRGTRDFAELIAQETRGGAELVEYALKVLRSPKSKPAGKQWAVEFLADRMLGKTPQAIEVSSDDPLYEARRRLFGKSLEELIIIAKTPELSEAESLPAAEPRALAAEYEKTGQ